MTTKIYGLYDEHDNLRYIGKTARSIHGRLEKHKRDSMRIANTHKTKWIRSMLQCGLNPSVKELAEVNGDGALTEMLYISIFRALGAELTNATDGGEGSHGRHESAETIQKGILTKIKNKTNSGWKWSKETKERVSALRKAKGTSKITARKMWENRRKTGWKQSTESYEKGVHTRRKNGSYASGIKKAWKTRRKNQKLCPPSS